jgi:hypothetical protein
MATYVIFRRSGWATAGDFGHAAARSTRECARRHDDVSWIRSYLLVERDGTLGTVCVYEAESPEAIRAHAAAAGLPVDEIVAVSDTVVVGHDPGGTS